MTILCTEVSHGEIVGVQNLPENRPTATRQFLHFNLRPDISLTLTHGGSEYFAHWWCMQSLTYPFLTPGHPIRLWVKSHLSATDKLRLVSPNHICSPDYAVYKSLRVCLWITLIADFSWINRAWLGFGLTGNETVKETLTRKVGYFWNQVYCCERVWFSRNPSETAALIYWSLLTKLMMPHWNSCWNHGDLTTSH